MSSKWPDIVEPWGDSKFYVALQQLIAAHAAELDELRYTSTLPADEKGKCVSTFVNMPDISGSDGYQHAVVGTPQDSDQSTPQTLERNKISLPSYSTSHDADGLPPTLLSSLGKTDELHLFTSLPNHRLKTFAAGGDDGREFHPALTWQDDVQTGTCSMGRFGAVQEEQSGDLECCTQSIEPTARAIITGKKLEQKPQSKLARLVNHSAFEGGFAFLIVVNAITIAFEAQYNGLDVGYKLRYPGYTESAAAAWPGVQGTINAFEVIFGVFFTVEVILKLIALRLAFFKSAWNIFDMFIGACWLAQEGFDLQLLRNPSILRLCRLARIMRIARLYKWISAMDSLHVLIKSIEASLSTLLWSSCLIIIMITLISLVVQYIILSYYDDESVPLSRRHEVYEYFGTFTRCAVSLFEATLGNFAPVMRKLTNNVQESWGLFFVAYKCVGGFAVVTVITGVFMQETFKVADTDDDLLIIRQTRQARTHVAKMSRLFRVADRTGKGALSFSDFKALIDDPFVKTWLAAYELDVADVRLLFRLMHDGDGRITAEKLVDGVSRLKGGAKSYDLHTIRHELREMMNCLCHRMDGMEAAQEKIAVDSRCAPNFTTI